MNGFLTFITTVTILAIVAFFLGMMWKNTGRPFPWETPEHPSQKTAAAAPAANAP
jgi:hypothetical protein